MTSKMIFNNNSHSSLLLSTLISSPLNRAKVSQVSIPAAAYGYPAGFVSGLSMEQTGIRPTYPFMIPGQYVTQMPYQQVDRRTGCIV